MCRNLGWMVWVLATACASQAGVATSSAPAAAIETELDPVVAQRIDEVFAEYDRSDVPGCVVAIARAGRLVHARGFGSANIEEGIPNAPATVFDIGSTSKQFTAACLVLLQQEGKLDLDDDVRRYLPELPDYGRPITIRHLLAHTSGLRDYTVLFLLAGVSYDDYTTSADTLAMLARQHALDFEPGSEHLYSNSGYFLAALIVERVAGVPFSCFARERIFEPLGMLDTHVRDDHAQVLARRAIGYEPRADGSFAIAMSDFEQTGDGTVHTTVADLARWDANFTTGAVGGADLAVQLTTPSRLDDGTELQYALGLNVSTYRGLPTVSHSGGWVGYRAEFLRFPEQGTTIVCLANRSDVPPAWTARRVADVLFEAELDAQTPRASVEPSAAPEPAPAWAPTPDELAAFVGAFTSDELACRYDFAIERGGLAVDTNGRGRLSLTPTAPECFEVGGCELVFERAASGEVTGFALSAGRIRNLRFRRI